MEPAAPTPALNKALARAIKACHAVIKRGEVKGKRTNYTFARSEDIISEARDALASNGLSLVPIHSQLLLDTSERVIGVDRTWSLRHESGEQATLSHQWPATCTDWKQPEKAVAGSSTTLFAYLIRDLLLLPRVDEEVDQDDGKGDVPLPQQKASRKTSPTRPAPARPAARVTTLKASVNDLRKKNVGARKERADDCETISRELATAMFPGDPPLKGSTQATDGSGDLTIVDDSGLAKRWMEMLRMLKDANDELGLDLSPAARGDLLIEWAKARTGVYPILVEGGEGRRIANGDVITANVLHALYDEFEEWHGPLFAAKEREAIVAG